jgi:hypothetical protein
MMVLLGPGFPRELPSVYMNLFQSVSSFFNGWENILCSAEIVFYGQHLLGEIPLVLAHNSLV